MAERPFAVSSLRARLALGLLAVMMLLGYTAALQVSFTSRVPGGNDLYPYWSAWRLYFAEGLSPYSNDSATKVQDEMYGAQIKPEQDLERQNRMVYPLYSIVLHGPFSALPFPWARALFMALSQVAAVVALKLTLDLTGWRPQRGLIIITAIFLLLFYPAARTFLLGQVSIFCFLFLILAVHQMDRRPGWAGLALALSTLKPNLVVVAVLLCVLWAVRRGRWRFVAAFALGLAILLGLSWLLLPTWLEQWLVRIVVYGDHSIGTPVHVFTQSIIPVFGTVAEGTISIVIIAITAWSWWRLWRTGDEARWPWTLGWTMVAANLIVPGMSTTSYVLLLPAIVLLFQWLQRRFGQRAGTALILAAEAVGFAGVWLLFLATVHGNIENPAMTWLFPLPLVALLPLVPRTVKR